MNTLDRIKDVIDTNTLGTITMIKSVKYVFDLPLKITIPNIEVRYIKTIDN